MCVDLNKCFFLKITIPDFLFSLYIGTLGIAPQVNAPFSPLDPLTK